MAASCSRQTSGRRGCGGGARQSLGSTDACREYAPTGTYCTHNHTHTGDRNRSSQGTACHAADRLTGNYISGSHPPPPLPTHDPRTETGEEGRLETRRAFSSPPSPEPQAARGRMGRQRVFVFAQMDLAHSARSALSSLFSLVLPNEKRMPFRNYRGGAAV